MNHDAFVRLRWPLIGGAVAIAVVVALGICEALGWPFLAAPLQRELSKALDRSVSFSADAGQSQRLVIRLLGGIRVQAAHIEIGAPPWSSAPFMLRGRDAQLTLGYADVWRASHGGALHIRELRAAQLDGQLERLADGRASWQFGKPREAAAPAAPLPTFGRLQLDAGTLVLRDAVMRVDMDTRLSLVDGALVATATGSYRKLPLNAEFRSGGVMPFIAEGDTTAALPVTLKAEVGRATLSFEGTATDILRLGALKGRFRMQGPSLAAVGDPLHVTLPTTGPFRAEGLVAKAGVVWNAVIEQATIGSSRLAGAFTYDPRPRVPMLAGRLTGTKLALADLGPTVGVAVPAAAASSPPRATAQPGRVLPDRAFDLPALRAMNANVLVDIALLDLGSSILEPLQPLRTHLVLADGVLTLRQLEARTAQGRLTGTVQLDGRNAQALWTADLRLAGVRLERWIHQQRAGNAPPYVTGNVAGQARLAGQGTSTATILGSLRGGVQLQLTGGTISHLAVEAAGLDIAQGLGMLIKGDDALPISCSVVDLAAERGLLKPRALVLDTPDSVLWVDGSLSLATEALDLTVVAAPKDFSPLAVRTPLHVRGSFANPSVSLDKARLGTRLGASALLALVNPLAALIPFIDVGSTAEAQRGADACRALARRAAAKSLPGLAAAAR